MILLAFKSGMRHVEIKLLNQDKLQQSQADSTLEQEFRTNRMTHHGITIK
jgi:hypothetical protein